MSKRGLFARLYAPNQTLIRVKTRLQKGNPDGGKGGLPSPWVSPGMRYFGLKTANRPPAISRGRAAHAVRRLGASGLKAKFAQLCGGGSFGGVGRARC